MSEKVIFNFFEPNTVVKSMCDFFNIEYEQMKKFIQENLDDTIENLENNFMETFNINDQFKDSDNCYIRLKHITTYNDNLESIKSYGLRDLVFLLKKEESFLNKFLKEREIKIIYKEKRIIICGKSYKLKMNYNMNELDDDEIERNFEIIYSKLYKDKGEIEAFLRGADNQITQYSMVRHAPEILQNIDNILRRLHSSTNLVYDWSHISSFQGYILEFDVPISKLSNGNDLLVNCFSTLQGNNSEKYAAIKNGTEIRFENLKIQKL